MKEKILNRFRNIDTYIFLCGGVVLLSLLFVLFYRTNLNDYSQFNFYINEINTLSPLVAYNASSLLGYALIAKIFGGSSGAYYWVAYSLFSIAYFLVGILGYYLIYKLIKPLSRFIQILLIPICLMILLNTGHLLSSFEAFIIPLSFGLLGLNTFVFYLLYKKNGLKQLYVWLYLGITLVIQVLFGSLLSLITIVILGVTSFVRYRKNKDNNYLIASLSAVTILLAYLVILIVSHHESGLVFSNFKVLTLAKGFLGNVSASLVGPYTETRTLPGFIFIIFGGFVFAFIIFVICFDISKTKKVTLRTFLMIALLGYIALETLLNGGTDFTLYFNPFGLVSSLLILTTIYTVIYDLKYLVSKDAKMNNLNPDLVFFLSAATLCVLLIGCLLAFGPVGNL